MKPDNSANVPSVGSHDVLERAGHEALWLWFGLSYASWLTLPRVLMHGMPDDWQARMAQLLAEYDAAFPNPPDLGTRVQVTKNGKLTKAPEWLTNYRHPDYESIKELRSNAVLTGAGQETK